MPSHLPLRPVSICVQALSLCTCRVTPWPALVRFTPADRDPRKKGTCWLSCLQTPRPPTHPVKCQTDFPETRLPFFDWMNLAVCEKTHSFTSTPGILNGSLLPVTSNPTSSIGFKGLENPVSNQPTNFSFSSMSITPGSSRVLSFLFPVCGKGNRMGSGIFTPGCGSWLFYLTGWASWASHSPSPSLPFLGCVTGQTPPDPWRCSENYIR